MSHTTFVLAGVSSYISGNISFPFFIAKNATVTAYLLESFLARFKKSRLLFYNDEVFARIQIKNENIQLLLLGSFLVSSSMKEEESSY